MGRNPRESTIETKSLSDVLSDLVDEKKRNDKIDHRTLCKEIGIGTGTLSEWTSDKKTPGLKNLVMLADYFGVSCDYLLGRSHIRTVRGNEQSAVSMGLPNEFVDYVMGLNHQSTEHYIVCSILSDPVLQRAISELSFELQVISEWHERERDQGAVGSNLSYDEYQVLRRSLFDKTNGSYSMVLTSIAARAMAQSAKDSLSDIVENCISDYCEKIGFDDYRLEDL